MSGRKTKKTSNSTTPARTPDMESNSWYETLVEEGPSPFSSPVRISIHSKRKRLTDADAVSAKAAIDGLVCAGLLKDDSPEFVKEVSYSQEKVTAEEEETIITLTEV